jgi:hypothetical protein
MLNGLTVLSLILFVAILGIWTCSYWYRSVAGIRPTWRWPMAIRNQTFYLPHAVHFSVERPRCFAVVLIATQGRTEIEFYFTDDLRPYSGPGAQPFFWSEFAHIDRAYQSWWYRHALHFERHGSGNLDRNGVVENLELTYWYSASDWFLLLIFAVLPALWLRKRMSRLRLKDGMCPSCGYDLTGNVSGVCPECGKLISKREILKAGNQ